MSLIGDGRLIRIIEPPAGLPDRPRVDHCVRDGLTKLHLVADGFGVTTVSSCTATVLSPGVTLLHVEGALPEIRRSSSRA